MRRSRKLGFWGLTALVVLAGPAIGLMPLGGPPAVEARVVGVQDGDTLTVRVDGAEERVRLVEIDAPESDQAYGAASKRRLDEMVGGRAVALERIGQDRYGRTLARVYVDGEDVNKAMVRSGAAWVYTAYSTDPSFTPLQAQARAEKAGLWAAGDGRVVAPWDWRRGATGASSPLVRTSGPWGWTEATVGCGKRWCAQMSSCGEARQVLAQCGRTSLDADGDGTPCETLCRFGG